MELDEITLAPKNYNMCKNKTLELVGISSGLSWDRKSQRAAFSCCRVAAGHGALSAQGGLSYCSTSKTSPPHQVPMNTFKKYFLFKYEK